MTKRIRQTASRCVPFAVLFAIRVEKERLEKGPRRDFVTVPDSARERERDGGRRSIGGSKDEMSVKMSREMVRREEGETKEESRINSLTRDQRNFNFDLDAKKIV